MNLDTNMIMKAKFFDRKFEVTGFYSSFRFDWNSTFMFAGESHEMWEAVFVRDGKVEVSENEKVFVLGRNNLIIHAPWEFHRIKSAAKTTPSGNVMSFFVKGELPRRLRDGIFILSEEQVLNYTSICDSASAFLSDESTSGYAGQEIADRLAAFLIRLSGETVHESTNSSPSAIEYKKIVTAMSNGVCENKTLSDFAVECGDSVSYMKQLFSKYAGASPKACYNKLRIRYAAKLLDEGETVRFVAQRMNFPSSNYFSSFFKKYTGLSPLEYKQRER